jgi:hypothetical protein
VSDCASSPYSGTENLEIMEEALNYNAFLQGLIVAHARLDQEILDFGAGTLARPLSACGYRITCVEPDVGLRARLEASGLVAHPTLDAIPTRSQPTPLMFLSTSPMIRGRL